MAKKLIRNGQTVTGSGATIEDEIIPNEKGAKVIFFQITSGTLQVTTDYEGKTDVIAAETFAFATTSGINRVTVELGDNAGGSNSGNPRKVIYIQGTGTGYFTW